MPEVKISDRTYNQVQKLITQFLESHPDKDEQTIQQFRAWIFVNKVAEIAITES